MVVVLMLGILSALAVPTLGRDRSALDGKAFVQTVARDIQRARMAAISERLPVRLFVFQDRIEIRSAVLGVRPGESPGPPRWPIPSCAPSPPRRGWR